MSEQTGAACGTGRGACPTVRGIPLQLLLVAGLVLYTAANGAWSAFEAERAGEPGVAAEVTARAGATLDEAGRVAAESPLAAFREPVEAIARAAASGGAAGPGAEAVAAIRAAFPEAEARWAAVEAASDAPASDAAGAGLTPAALDRREALMAAERDALDALARALETGDGRAIGRAAAALEAAFSQLVLLYG